MNSKKAIKLSLASVAVLVALYVLFNWVMSAAVHSRKEVMVPDLKGKSIDAALAVVSPMNLGLKKEGEEFDEKVPAGTIIRQNPLPGMTVREGKIIRITISQGGKVTFVPDLVNQPVRAAEITIRSSGFSLGEESSRFSIVVEKGNVVSQDPPAGSIAEKDALVNLVISAGKPPDEIRLMPKFVGRDIEEARQWAEKSGVELNVQEEKNEAAPAGTILRQAPAPDTDITVQRIVTLVTAGSENSVSSLPETKFHYEIPQGGEERQIRLTLLDDNGEKEIFQGVRPPGSKLEIPVHPQGSARVRVFINNILVEEREVK